ncbi:MAG TPA: proton-conducting transporter membrane subunit [Paracoccaceae bacterium]|nr:proton-conducting transporter membrane subunit [Paracoccaceae bacterium]
MTALSPLLLCWLAAPFFLLLDGRRPAVSWAAAGLLGAVTALDIVLLAQMAWGDRPPLVTVTGGWPVGLGIRLRVDGLALFFGAVSAAVITAAMVHDRGPRARSAYLPALLLFMCAGLHGAFFTGDLFNFYVFFEVSVVTSFALAAYGYGRQEARAAFIYIAVNLLGSVIFLTGIAVVYHQTGMLDLMSLWQRGEGTWSGISHLGAALLFCALSLKLGLFPLHYWVPVLYSNAHPAVAAVMSGALINIGSYGLLRIGMTAAEASRAAGSDLLLLIGSLAVLYGGILASQRVRLAEILAYASIAQAGYVVIGLGVGGIAGTAAALFAVLAGSIEKAAGFLSLESAGRWRTLSALAGAAGVAGLPVTLGFLTKVELFRAAWTSGAAPGLFLALIGATGFLFVAMARFWGGLRRVPAPPAPSVGPPAVLAALTVGLGAAAAPLGALVLWLSHALLEGRTP